MPRFSNHQLLTYIPNGDGKLVDAEHVPLSQAQLGYMANVHKLLSDTVVKVDGVLNFRNAQELGEALFELRTIVERARIRQRQIATFFGLRGDS